MVPGEDSMAGAAAAGNVDTEYAVPWNGRRNESERVGTVVGTSQGGLKPADFLEISEISEISTEFCRILMDFDVLNDDSAGRDCWAQT